MSKIAHNRITIVTILLFLMSVLSGCGSTKPLTLFNATQTERIFTLMIVSMVTILVFAMIFVSDRESSGLYENIRSRFIRYLVHFLVSCLVGFVGGGIIAFLGIVAWRWLSQDSTIVYIGIAIVCLIIMGFLREKFFYIESGMNYHTAHGRPAGGGGVWRGFHHEGYLWEKLKYYLAWYGISVSLLLLIRSVVKLLIKLGISIPFLGDLSDILSSFSLAFGASLIVFGISYVILQRKEDDYDDATRWRDESELKTKKVRGLRNQITICWIGMSLGILGGIASTIYLLNTIISNLH